MDITETITAIITEAPFLILAVPFLIIGAAVFLFWIGDLLESVSMQLAGIWRLMVATLILMWLIAPALLAAYNLLT